MSRAVVLFLAAAACGSDPTANPDAAPSVDGPRPPDAAPHGRVELGTLDHCPDQMFVADGYLYWFTNLDERTIARTPIDAYAPEEIYRDRGYVNGLQPAPGALVWETPTAWPVRLDLSTRQARPLIEKDAQIGVADGRIFAWYRESGVNHVDEIRGEVVTPFATTVQEPSWFIDGPHRLYWWDGQMHYLSVVDGSQGAFAAPTFWTTYADRTTLYAVARGSDGVSTLETWGTERYHVHDLPPAQYGAVTGGNGGPLYLLAGRTISRYDAVSDTLTPLDVGADLIASDGAATFLFDCAGGRTLARYYP